MKIKVYASIMTLTCLTYMGQAFGQALPWQTGQQSQQSLSSPPQAVQPHQHQHHSDNAPATQTAPAPQNDQRTEDDRRLNDLASQFYKITPQDKQVIPKLKALLKNVKAFHAALLQSKYNAVDIIRDTESLEQRVSKQLGGLEAKTKSAQAAQ